MTLERVRRATKEEIQEIKDLKKGLLDYLEMKGIDDGLILSTLTCLTAQAAMDKGVKKSSLYGLLGAIWKANSKEEEQTIQDRVEIIKKRIHDTLEDGEFEMIDILAALSLLAMGAAAHLKFSKKKFIAAVDAVWDDIEKSYEDV